MYINYCIICGKPFKTNSKRADVCSKECRIQKAAIPKAKLKAKEEHHSSQLYLEVHKSAPTVSHNRQNNKKVESMDSWHNKKLAPELLQKMTWTDKYNAVDSMTKVSMLSSALEEIDIKYSYGELRFIYESDKPKYKKLEQTVLKYKSN